MKSPFGGLVRLYLASVYGLKPLSEYRTRKDWLKLAGLVLLFLVILADFGFIFVASSLSQYAALKPQGLQGLLLLNAAITSTMIVFILGFIMALSTWSLSAAEQSLLALPLSPRDLLGAKFIVVYLSEFSFALFLIGINLVVFGINEGPHPLFYLCGLVVALAIPLFPLAIAYLILVPIMSLSRLLRSKNAVLVIAGIVGVGFALAFNVYIQGSMAKMGDPEWILSNYAGPGTVLNLLGSAWPPSALAWKALEAAASGSWLQGLGLSLALVAAGVLTVGLVVLALAAPYARSLRDFGEGVFRRLAGGEARRFIRARFSRGGLFRALVIRENRLMNREPMYLLNGPGIVILMPLILVIMYFVQRSALSELAPFLEAARRGPWGLLAGAAFGAFLGSSTSIACTALSRDAKALPFLRALPIPTRSYLFAKLAHGLAYALFGCLVGGIGVGLVVGLGPTEIAAAVFIGLAYSGFANMAGLWIDTANPRLSWDNPVAALKQNPNSVIAILGTMAILGGLGVLASVLPLDALGFTLAYGGGSALLFVVLALAYPAWAERRMADLDI